MWRDNINQKRFCEQLCFPKLCCLRLQACRKIRTFSLSICLPETFRTLPTPSAAILRNDAAAAPRMMMLMFSLGPSFPFECARGIKSLIELKAGQLGITVCQNISKFLSGMCCSVYPTLGFIGPCKLEYESLNRDTVLLKNTLTVWKSQHAVFWVVNALFNFHWHR